MDKTIKIWNVTPKLLQKFKFKSKSVLVKTLVDHKASVYTIIELSNGKLASGSRDSQVCLWNIEDGELLECLNDHTAGVLSLSKLSDGKLLSSSADKTINIWHV